MLFSPYNDGVFILNEHFTPQVDELNEELQGYKELSGAKHADKIDKLIDNLTSDLQRNTRQILYDQLIRVKSETSHLLNGNADEITETTVHTGESSIVPSLLNEELVVLDTAAPVNKKARTDGSISP